MRNYNNTANDLGLTRAEARAARKNHAALYGLLLALIAMAASAMMLVFMPQVSVGLPPSSWTVAPTATVTPQPPPMDGAK
jgi:hypothetical protein